MGITINQSPALYTPVYNPMRFVITSTNSAQANFNYIVDVYTSGVSGYTRLLFPPDPTTGRAAPDIQAVLEAQITFDLSDTTYNFQRCTNSIKAYEVKFGEQYGALGNIQDYEDLTVTGLKYAWNGVVSPNVFRTFDYTLYTMGAGSACLTSKPNDLYFTSTSSEHDWLYFINDTSGSVYFSKVRTYDVNDNLLGTYLIENADQVSSSYLMKLQRAAVGTADLNAATLYSGSQPVITSSVEKYIVNLTNFAQSVNSEEYTYHKECQWRGQSPITIHFLNRLGGFDTFNFRLSRKKYSDIERDKLQKNLGSLSGTSWSYASQDRGIKVYNTQITDRWSIESDWINEAQSTWLQELIESPEVYYHDGTSLIPVDVKNGTTELKNIKGMNRLFSLSMEMEFANKRWTQRG